MRRCSAVARILADELWHATIKKKRLWALSLARPPPLPSPPDPGPAPGAAMPVLLLPLLLGPTAALSAGDATPLPPPPTHAGDATTPLPPTSAGDMVALPPLAASGITNVADADALVTASAVAGASPRSGEGTARVRALGTAGATAAGPRSGADCGTREGGLPGSRPAAGIAVAVAASGVGTGARTPKPASGGAGRSSSSSSSRCGSPGGGGGGRGGTHPVCRVRGHTGINCCGRQGWPGPRLGRVPWAAVDPSSAQKRRQRAARASPT